MSKYVEPRLGKGSFRIDVPEYFNFALDVVDVYAEKEPERRALVWCDDRDGSTRVFSFADLSKGSAQAAHFLTSLGVKKGDAVMLILRRRWEFWYFLLALHRIGAIAVPATNMLLADDIVYRNNTAGIKVIIALEDAKLLNEVDKARPQSPTVHSYVKIGREERQGWFAVDCDNLLFNTDYEAPGGRKSIANSDVMLLYFTSGTSGYPKMVQHNFTYPLGHIATAKYWQNCIDGGLHLSVAETGWAKAMWGKIYGQWLAGSAVFVYDMASFMPGKLLEKMAAHGVNTFCAPPTVYRYLTRLDLSKYDMSALCYCTTAGEALEPEIAEKWKRQTGLEIHEGYGQTELTLTIGDFVGMEPRPGSMGKAAPGYTVDIVDNEGVSCPLGQPGEIILRLGNCASNDDANNDEVRPLGMFAGYYKDPGLTAAAFAGNIYHTGDLAAKDAEGYFYFLGRKDDMIKSAGYRISPFEVESALVKHPAVLECAVTGVADPRRGQAVKASVVLAQGWEPNPALERELRDFVKARTAAYKYPRIVEFVEALPKTISGKIRRAAIRGLDALQDKVNNIYSH